jgi:hypothetical protein
MNLKEAKLETKKESLDIKLYTIEQEVIFAPDNEQTKQIWFRHLEPLIEK